MALKIVCISDTHNHDLVNMKLPEADLLIHCGDWSGRGTIQELVKINKQLQFIKNKYKYGIIGIPGNHDWLFETNPTLAKEIMDNVKILIDEAIEIEGVKIYGSPWQPEFCSWAFNLPRGERLEEVWSRIPEDTEILISHGPPMGILDLTPRGEHVGCLDLRNRIEELKNVKYCLFGHIHKTYGTEIINNITYVNASICDETYYANNEPILLDYHSK